MNHRKLFAPILLGALYCSTVEAWPVSCGPPHDGYQEQHLAWRPLTGQQTALPGRGLTKGVVETAQAIQAAVQTPGHPGPPDGGNGDNCQLLRGSDAVDWSQTTLIARSDHQGPGYVEAPLRQIARGQGIELQLEVQLSDVAILAGTASHAFVELDLDRGDERALLPLRIALKGQPEAVATLRLEGANARPLQSAPAADGTHELRLHWQQLDVDRGQLSLLLDGQVLGTNMLRGIPVALRLGELDLKANDAMPDFIGIRAATLTWQH